MPQNRYAETQLQIYKSRPHAAILVPGLGNSIQGGASTGPLPSFSINGGGSVGALDSQSINGGGSLTNINWEINNNATSQHSVFSTFVKVNAFPGSQTTLYDINAGVAGYHRVSLLSTGDFSVDTLLFGSAPSTTNFGLTLSTNTWYYVGTYITETGTQYLVNYFAYGPSGVVLVNADTVVTATSTSITYSAALGWGETLTSGYNNFPNTAGNELSKLWVQLRNANHDGMPTADPTPDGNTQLLCLCRQTLGSILTINDSSGNSNNLTAGPLGATCVLDGPFAS